MIKHVVFDFDGTIVDSRYLIIDLINQLTHKYNLRSLKEQDYSYLRSLTVVDRCRFIGLPLYKLPLFKLDLTGKYQESAGIMEPVPGLKDVLAGLKESGLKLSIISSNSVDNINRFLDNNNIDFFDNIYSSRGIFGKDRTIAKFLRKHRLKSRDVIYIGDECRDIAACRKNSVKVIAVSWGYDSRELLSDSDPDFLVDNPVELFELIQKLIKANIV